MYHVFHQIERTSPASAPIRDPNVVIPKLSEGSTSNIFIRAGNTIFRIHAVVPSCAPLKTTAMLPAVALPGPEVLNANRFTIITLNEVEQMTLCSPANVRAL